jgi:hypothetical protein
MDLVPGAYRGQPPETHPAFVDRAFYWDGSLTAKGHKSYVVQCGAGRQSRRVSLQAG